MYYRLMEPQEIREAFRDLDVLTQEQISLECGISLSAVRQALQGEEIQAKTVTAIARRLGRRVREIAVPVQ